MARTADELMEDQQQEEAEEEEAAVESEGEDDEVPYNPKNLPLGWDGKVGDTWLAGWSLTSLSISLSSAHSLLALQATWSQHHLLL